MEYRLRKVIMNYCNKLKSDKMTKDSFNAYKSCKLVGLYLLDKLSKLLEKQNLGLHRNYRLAVVNVTSDSV